MHNPKNQCDLLWLNANLITCEPNENSSLGIIRNAAIAIDDGKIAWLGSSQKGAEKYKSGAKKIIDAKNAWIIPGLIDPHTHLVYAGERSDEFALRLQGKSYTDIAKGGGGILRTVQATRAASPDALFEASAKRLKSFLAQGVTTLEIKSGYGLDLQTEKKCLLVAKQLAKKFPITMRTSYLGAHSLAPEFSTNESYIHFICTQVLPQLQRENLINAVDAYCESLAFSCQQLEPLLMAAQKLGLPIKLHAEQFSHSGACQLAAKYKALSVDHLEHASEQDIAAIANSNTVAVLLPGAFYFLQERQAPPVDLLRQYQVPIALGSDCNPGTSPMTSLLLVLNMACILFGLTVTEALLGVTLNAAKALDLADTHGSLKVGKVADLAIWNISKPAELIYTMGLNPCIGVVKDGNFTGI